MLIHPKNEQTLIYIPDSIVKEKIKLVTGKSVDQAVKELHLSQNQLNELIEAEAIKIARGIK